MALRMKEALVATLCVVGVAAGIGLGSGSAMADPDQAPVDPAVINAPPVEVLDVYRSQQSHRPPTPPPRPRPRPPAP